MDKYLIAGLGNPGAGHRKNRHNAGYIVVDEIARLSGFSINRKLSAAKTGKYIRGDKEFLFVKPVSYMNNSGIALNSVVYKEKMSISGLVVIYDDIDLPFGTVRYRNKGSAGTHNGMRSVIANLGSSEFKRIRVGIGKPPAGEELVSYVLGNFSKEQLDILKNEITPQIIDKLFGDFLTAGGDQE